MDSSDDIIVVVLSHSGEDVIRQLMPRETLVGDVKSLVAKRKQLPKAFLKLVAGTAVLQDHTPLADIEHGPRELLMSMLVSLQSVLQDLDRPHDGAKKMKTLQVVTKYTESGFISFETGIEALSSSVADADGAVRAAAIKGLARATKGRIETLAEALCLQLQCPSESVREDVIKALGTVIPKGVESAIEATTALLDHQEVPIRIAAVRALESIVTEDDRRLADASLQQLADAEEAVRQTGLCMLGRLAVKGDADALAAVRRLLGHAHPGIRTTALRAIQCVTHPGDPHRVDMLIGTLSDGQEEVRSTALQVLSDVAIEVDDNTHVAVNALLGHTDPGVRLSAMLAIDTIYENDDARALTSFCACLADPANGWSAADLLSKRANKGDEKALSAARALLTHADKDTRIVALCALTTISEASDRRVICDLLSKLEDEDNEVKSRAAEFLGNLVAQGDGEVIARLVTLGRHENKDVRWATVYALRSAPRGLPCVVATLLASLDDVHVEVSSLVAQSLGHTAEAGDCLVVEKLSSYITGRIQSELDLEFVPPAFEGLIHVAPRGDARALGAVQAGLQCSMVEARYAALRAFGDLAEEGDKQVVSRLAAILLSRDPADYMESELCARALRKGASKRDERAIGALFASTELEGTSMEAVLTALAELCALNDERLIRLICNQFVDAEEEGEWARRRFALIALYRNGSDCEDVIDFLCGCLHDGQRELRSRCFAAEALKWILEGSDGENNMAARVDTFNVQLLPRVVLGAFARLQTFLKDYTERDELEYETSRVLEVIKQKFDVEDEHDVDKE